MNRTEFIKLIIDKKSLDKDIFKLSLNLDDFPIARQILNKIDGNIYTETILESNEIVEIQTARGKLISNLVNSLKDSLLKSETRKFIDDLVDQKIFSSSFDKTAQSTKSSSDNKLISELKSLREERVRESSNEENNFEDRNITSNEEESIFFKPVIFILLGILGVIIVPNLYRKYNYCAKNTRGETICIKKQDISCKTSDFLWEEFWLPGDGKYNKNYWTDRGISCRASGTRKDLTGYKSHWFTQNSWGDVTHKTCFVKRWDVTRGKGSGKVKSRLKNPNNLIVCSAAYHFNLVNEELISDKLKRL